MFDITSYVIGLENGAVPTEQKTVELDMSKGNQVVTPVAGYVMSAVTVNKPDTLVPENIKAGVNIGGVIGTYEPSPTN